MKKTIFSILLLLISAVTITSQAQKQFGTWTNISIDKKINKKWNWGAETELRTIYGFQLINRWSIGVDAQYKISKPFEIGLGYQFMNTLDEKYENYQFRNRLMLDLTGKKKWGDFSFSLSEGLQFTTKNDSKRIMSDETIDTYKINPAWMWKNDFEVEYNIPKCKITPEFNFKTYYSLNNPDGNEFDKLRYILSFKYKLNKQNSISLFGVYNKELGSDGADYSGKYDLGIKYTHHF